MWDILAAPTGKHVHELRASMHTKIYVINGREPTLEISNLRV